MIKECQCCGKKYNTTRSNQKFCSIKCRAEVRKISVEEKRLKHILWGMKQRCYNAESVSYKNYGGKSITICNEWIADFKNFYNWAINNGYKDNLTIDRINNNGNYEPNNCRWVTTTEQNWNRRNNSLVTYRGQTKSLAEWCNILGIHYNAIWYRINHLKYSIQKAFEEELHKGEVLTLNGETKSIKKWCDFYGIKYNTYYARVNRYGMNKLEALTTKKIQKNIKEK